MQVFAITISTTVIITTNSIALLSIIVKLDMKVSFILMHLIFSISSFSFSEDVFHESNQKV